MLSLLNSYHGKLGGVKKMRSNNSENCKSSPLVVQHVGTTIRTSNCCSDTLSIVESSFEEDSIGKDIASESCDVIQEFIACGLRHQRWMTMDVIRSHLQATYDFEGMRTGFKHLQFDCYMLKIVIDAGFPGSVSLQGSRVVHGIYVLEQRVNNKKLLFHYVCTPEYFDLPGNRDVEGWENSTNTLLHQHTKTIRDVPMPRINNWKQKWIPASRVYRSQFWHFNNQMMTLMTTNQLMKMKMKMMKKGSVFVRTSNG